MGKYFFMAGSIKSTHFTAEWAYTATHFAECLVFRFADHGLATGMSL